MDVVLCCDEGRECVIRIAELMKEAMEIVRSLKPVDPDKKDILQEYLTNILKEFEYLRIFYNVCEANAPESTDIQKLIPYADKMPTKEPTGEVYAEACKERDALKEEVARKNEQLAEVITHLRKMICSINCMLAYVNIKRKEISKTWKK